MARNTHTAVIIFIFKPRPLANKSGSEKTNLISDIHPRPCFATWGLGLRRWIFWGCEATEDGWIRRDKISWPMIWPTQNLVISRSIVESGLLERTRSGLFLKRWSLSPRSSLTNCRWRRREGSTERNLPIKARSASWAHGELVRWLDCFTWS